MASLIRALKRVSVLLVLTGCAGTVDLSLQTPPTLVEQTAVVQWRSNSFQLVLVPQVQDIFYLNKERQKHFLDFYHASDNLSVDRHKRLFNYLERVLDGFSYKGDTYNADLASTLQSGNCLSLAILTKAYASLANLEVHYRKVNLAPIYQRQQGVMTISSHVQTYIYAPVNIIKSKGEFSLFRSKIIIDYFPTSNRVLGTMVDNADFVAMYYQNLAAEAIIDKRFDLAYSLLSAAMELSPNNIDTLNSLAVLYKKTGHSLAAETIYLHGLEHTKGSVNLLSNYIILLQEMGRLQDAVLLQEQYQYIEDNSPFTWFDLANKAYGDKNYSAALRYYEKSIQVAPYLHESFFGQAKTYFHLGKRHKAQIAMKRATELAFKPSDEKLYLAKLNSLTENISEQ